MQKFAGMIEVLVIGAMGRILVKKKTGWDTLWNGGLSHVPWIVRVYRIGRSEGGNSSERTTIGKEQKRGSD